MNNCPSSGVSTWSRKVATRTWDSLRRSGSTDRLPTTAAFDNKISFSSASKSNQKKTSTSLRQTSDPAEENHKRRPTLPAIHNKLNVESPCSSRSSPNTGILRRNLSRVESLRNLLTKSNRTWAKSARMKMDKGVDTQDFDGDCEQGVCHNDDEVFASVRTRGPLPRPLSKSTSCDNLSFTSRVYLEEDDAPAATCISVSSGENYHFGNMKRPSFPHAFIRSKLSSLPEEPQAVPHGTEFRSTDIPNSYHSMGNLLLDDPGAGKLNLNNPDGSQRVCDPLSKMRIDLIHATPEWEDEDMENTIRKNRRRSLSIGDILNSSEESITFGSFQHREESGYDSDSTRNGNESPRNSANLQTHELDECHLKEDEETIHVTIQTSSQPTTVDNESKKQKRLEPSTPGKDIRDELVPRTPVSTLKMQSRNTILSNSTVSIGLRKKGRDPDSTVAQPSKSVSLTLFTISFHKGPTRKGLGFSVGRLKFCS